MEKDKIPINYFVLQETLRYFRPKKLYDLSEIKNENIRTLAKAFRTAFYSPEQLKNILYDYYTDYVYSNIKGYKEGDLIANIIPLIERIKGLRNRFVNEYKSHYDKFSEFKLGLNHLEVMLTTLEVQSHIIEKIISEYDEILDIVQKSGIEITRNPELPPKEPVEIPQEWREYMQQ